MSDQIVSGILENRLNDEWGSLTPIAWENVEYTPSRGVAFIRPILDGIDAINLSVHCQRYFYLFTIQVFTPASESTQNNLMYVDAIKNIFRNFSQGNLFARKLYAERATSEKEWYQRNVLIDITYDEFS